MQHRERKGKHEKELKETEESKESLDYHPTGNAKREKEKEKGTFWRRSGFFQPLRENNSDSKRQ